MMKSIILAASCGFAALLGGALAACQGSTKAREYEPPAACDPAMRGWILQCIANANPHSDEEPEDYTRQCELTAVHLFCGSRCFLSNNGGILCHVDPKVEE